MSTIVSGVVTNGVVVPVSPLPEGAHVAIHLDDVVEIPKDLHEGSPRPPRRAGNCQGMFAIVADDAEHLKEFAECTATELRKMPRTERQAILTAAAALAEEDYRTDKELTGFDAFSEEEIDDDESSQG